MATCLSDTMAKATGGRPILYRNVRMDEISRGLKSLPGEGASAVMEETALTDICDQAPPNEA